MKNNNFNWKDISLSEDPANIKSEWIKSKDVKHIPSMKNWSLDNNKFSYSSRIKSKNKRHII